MKVPLLDLQAQYRAIRQEVKSAVDEVLDSQHFILGPKVEALEAHVAGYCGTKHAIGVSSGTDALLVALMALGVGPGDAVITTPYSFFATAGSVSRLGAMPVFVDIEPDSWNIDPAKVKKALAGRKSGAVPKVLLPVHLFGQCADMDPLLELAREHGLAVVEDAAQAIGTEYPARKGVVKAGAMGDVGCFSFFPSKNLGGCGDGGMVTTNRDDLAAKLRRLRNHGAEPKYYHSEIGGNFRLDAIQAAILDVKLNHLERWHQARRENAAFYDRAFSDSPVKTPRAIYQDSGIHNFHIYNQYVVRVQQRDRVKDALKSAGIGTEVYYPVPLHLQRCFSSLGYHKGSFPESECAADESLALPIYPELTEEMREQVVGVLLESV